MSKVAIQGDTNGSAVFTIAAPISNTNRTLTLPDSTGALLNDASSLAAANLTGTIAKARLPAGSVLQVTQVLNTTDTTITSTVDFITASITPSSTSSKILVMGNLASVARRSNSSSEGLFWLVRNGNSLGTFDGITPWNGGATDQRSVGSIHVQYLDSPSSTSSVTYILRANCSASGVDINDEGGISSLTLMEIAG